MSTQTGEEKIDEFRTNSPVKWTMFHMDGRWRELVF